MEKKDWEIFRDTGVLGEYRPEAVKLNETQYGDVMTWFEDEACWSDRNQSVRERDNGNWRHDIPYFIGFSGR